jgi:single-strand DNA-binding protein
LRSVNKVILLGNLGKDAETKFTPSGVAKTTFSVATTRKWKQGEEWQEKTDWHNVVLWRSEGVSAYLLKGKPVYVEGRIETRDYEKDGQKRYITEIIADNVILLGGERGEKPEPAPSIRTPQAKDDGFNGQGITDDDCPF